MHHKEFLKQVDDSIVVTAIAEAEKLTSGEIRVWISRRNIGNALEGAHERFHKLGMHNTAERNSVLIFIAPNTQVFAVIGDTAVHEKCGVEFWEQTTRQLTADLKNGDISGALVNAVRKIGGLLATHFPRKPGDKNELPDDVMHD